MIPPAGGDTLKYLRFWKGRGTYPQTAPTPKNIPVKDRPKRAEKNYAERENLPLALDVLKLRCFQLQGGCFGLWLPEQGLCPLTPLGALQEPTGSTCSHHHVLDVPFTVTTALHSYSYNMKIKKLQYHNHTH